MDANQDSFGDSQTIFGSTVISQAIAGALKGIDTSGIQRTLQAEIDDLQDQIDDTKRSIITLNGGKTLRQINDNNPMDQGVTLDLTRPIVITNDPTISQAVATKHYTDQAISGLQSQINIEKTVRAASDLGISTALSTEVATRATQNESMAYDIAFNRDMCDQRQIGYETSTKLDMLKLKTEVIPLLQSELNSAAYLAANSKDRLNDYDNIKMPLINGRITALETSTTTSASMSLLSDRVSVLEGHESNDLDRHEKKIVNMAPGTSDSDAITKKQLDEAISAIPIASTDNTGAQVALGLGAAGLATSLAGVGAALLSTTAGQAMTGAIATGASAFIGGITQRVAGDAASSAASGLLVKPEQLVSDGFEMTDPFNNSTIDEFRERKIAQLARDPAMAYLMSEPGGLLYAENIGARSVTGLNSLSIDRPSDMSFSQEGLLWGPPVSSFLETIPETTEPEIDRPETDWEQQYSDVDVASVGAIRKLVFGPWITGRLNVHHERLLSLEETTTDLSSTNALEEEKKARENADESYLQAANAYALEIVQPIDFQAKRANVRLDAVESVASQYATKTQITDLQAIIDTNATGATLYTNSVVDPLKDRVTAIETSTETSASVTAISDRLNVLEQRKLHEIPVAGLLEGPIQLNGNIIRGVANDADDPQLVNQAVNFGSMTNFVETKVGDASVILGQQLQEETNARVDSDAALNTRITTLENPAPITGIRFQRGSASATILDDDGTYVTINPVTSSQQKGLIIKGRIVADPDDDDQGLVVWGSNEYLTANAASARYYTKEYIDAFVAAQFQALPEPLVITETNGITTLKQIASDGTAISTQLLTNQDLSAQNAVVSQLMDQKDSVILAQSKAYTDAHTTSVDLSSYETVKHSSDTYVTKTEFNAHAAGEVTARAGITNSAIQSSTAFTLQEVQKAKTWAQSLISQEINTTQQLFQSQISGINLEGLATTYIPRTEMDQLWASKQYLASELTPQILSVMAYVDQQVASTSGGGSVDLSAYARQSDLLVEQGARATGDQYHLGLANAYTDQKLVELVIPSTSGLLSEAEAINKYAQITWVNQQLQEHPTLAQLDTKKSEAVLAAREYTDTIASELTPMTVFTGTITAEQIQRSNEISASSIADRLYTDNAVATKITQAQCDTRYKQITTTDSSIVSSDGQNGLICATNNGGVIIKSNNKNIGTISRAVGQSTDPLLIYTGDKLQCQSGLGSMSFYGTGNNQGVYIGSSTDSTTQNCYDQLVVGNGTNRQGVVISSGHSSTNIPYSVICNQAASSLQNLQISPEISTDILTKNALYMYGDSVATLFPIQNQFTRATGRNSAMSSCSGNEFPTYAFVQSYISSLGAFQAQACYTITLAASASINIGNTADNTALVVTKNNGSAFLNATGTHLYRSIGAPNCSTLRLSFVTASDTVSMYHWDWSIIDATTTTADNDTQTRQLSMPVVRPSATAGTFYVDITKASNGACNAKLVLKMTKL